MIKKKLYDFLSRHMSYVSFQKIMNKYQEFRGRNTLPEWKKAYYIRNDKRNRNQKYMLFRMAIPGHMLIAAGIQYLYFSEFAHSKGMIPILDLEYEYIFQQGKIGYDNLWETCFEQPKVKDIIKNENVWIEEFETLGTILPEMCQFVNGDEKDHYIHTKEENWREYYEKVHHYLQKCWIIKPKILEELEKEWRTIIDSEDKVLGISLREDFSNEAHVQTKEATKALLLKHPIGPNVDEVIEIAKSKFQLWGCNKIFLSTIYESSITEFQKAFGDAVVYMKHKRRTGLDIYQKMPDIAAMSSNEIYDYYSKHRNVSDTTVSYLKEIVGLSKCDYLLAAKSSGSIAALSMNGGKYNDIHILSDKNHIERY